MPHLTSADLQIARSGTKCATTHRGTVVVGSELRAPFPSRASTGQPGRNNGLVHTTPHREVHDWSQTRSCHSEGSSRHPDDLQITSMGIDLHAAACHKPRRRATRDAQLRATRQPRHETPNAATEMREFRGRCERKSECWLWGIEWEAWREGRVSGSAHAY